MINYDLLVGDVSFYNRTLGFALRENAENGEKMLRLVEDLMAPWNGDDSTACNNETSLINVRATIESKIVIYLLMVATMTSLLLFFATSVSLVLNSLCAVYYWVSDTLCSRCDEDSDIQTKPGKCSNSFV